MKLFSDFLLNKTRSSSKQMEENQLGWYIKFKLLSRKEITEQNNKQSFSANAITLTVL